MLELTVMVTEAFGPSVPPVQVTLLVVALAALLKLQPKPEPGWETAFTCGLVVPVMVSLTVIPDAATEPKFVTMIV